MEMTPNGASKKHRSPDSSHHEDALVCPVCTDGIDFDWLTGADNECGLEWWTGDTTGYKTQDGDDWQSINASVHCNAPFNRGASSSGFAVGCGLERWRQARLHVREGFFGSSSLLSLPLSVRFIPSPT